MAAAARTKAKMPAATLAAASLQPAAALSRATLPQRAHLQPQCLYCRKIARQMNSATMKWITSVTVLIT
jgi:hypothetical protein